MFNQSVSSGVKTLMDAGFNVPAQFTPDGINRFNSTVPGGSVFPSLKDYVKKKELEDILKDYVTKKELEDYLKNFGEQFVTWDYSKENLVHYDWFYDFMKSYPTWDGANKAYVNWKKLDDYPTWKRASETYVDWGTFNNVVMQVVVAAQNEVMTALMGLGINAECDKESGTVTVTLTGKPSTSVTPDWPQGPWSGGASPGLAV